MLSPNYSNFIQQPKAQQIVFQNSFDSANGSYNNSSLLTAANTLTFNSPPTAYTPSSNNSEFSKALLNMHTNQSSDQDDLDFDLHYNSKSGFSNHNSFNNRADVELLDDIDETLDDEDLASEFERAIKGYEETKPTEMAPKRVLNNPISFVSSDFVDSTRRLNFSESPSTTGWGLSFKKDR